MLQEHAQLPMPDEEPGGTEASPILLSVGPVDPGIPRIPGSRRRAADHEPTNASAIVIEWGDAYTDSI